MIRSLAITTLAVASALPISAAFADRHHSGPAMNYHVIDESLATGGHFVDDGLEHLAEQGLALVIDLREHPPEQSARQLAALGIDYENVPVSWKKPTLSQYEQFRDVLLKNRDRQVLVQCAANYRASAMTYLFRVLEENIEVEQATADRASVWELNDNWRKYLADVIAAQ